MATRREKCKWCRVKLLVPLEAQSVRCPNCQTTVEFRFSSNYSLPKVNGYQNGAPVGDMYNMNMGLPAYNNHLRPTPALLPAQSPKRAVLCGVSYKNHERRLTGSVNDVLSMRYFLVERMGFPRASVLLLTEEEQNACRIPTKQNIRAAFRWLTQGSKAGDSLVFHYSGHGSRMRDQNGDELDGIDEALCPVDFETQGKILDDEINASLVRPIPYGATLHAIIDTCFSGTFLDLPYLCRMNREGSYKWEDHRVRHAYNGTKGGLAISISACDDHENSGDTTAFNGTSVGALTYSFIETMEREPRLTYGRLLMSMRSKIYNKQRELEQSSIPGSKLSQEPQLSSSELFDIHTKPFFL